ncbi:hypothetical protein niasHS_014047 [Heterodera schachtii]|uniref:Uncharacterized protein n=1 Tax=Heterodera schachtii TaxID=97005 RepID=A0ABD2IQB9_HETSC
MYYGGGRRSSMVHKDGNCGKDDLRLCAIFGRSHVLGTEPNAKAATVTESELPQSYSATLPPPHLDAASDFFSTSNSDNDVLPPFDLLASVTLPPVVQCRKFFADLRPVRLYLPFVYTDLTIMYGGPPITTLEDARADFGRAKGQFKRAVLALPNHSLDGTFSSLSAYFGLDSSVGVRAVQDLGLTDPAAIFEKRVDLLCEMVSEHWDVQMFGQATRYLRLRSLNYNDLAGCFRRPSTS